MQLAGVTPRAFLRITQVTAALVVLNIVSGAAVRLTDSGLGCPDWPTCSQHRLTPKLSFHPAVEFGNRLVVVVLCVLAVVAVVAAWRRMPRRRDLSWLAGGLLGGVLGEAVLGGIVVYTKLNAYVVMTHFMVGMALLTDAVVLVMRAGREPGAAVAKVGRRELWTCRAVLGVLALAIAAGTATTGAGPHAGGKGAKRVPMALGDMARIHSAIVIAAVVLTGALLYLLVRTGAPRSVLDRARIVVGTMVVQGAIGYAQYFSHLPALLVGVHVFGATVVWSALLWFHDGLTHRAAPVGEAPAAPTTAAAAALSAPAAPAAPTPTPVPAPR